MLAAKNTFIDFVLNYVGLTNIFSHLNRYPEVDEMMLKKEDPDFCFLSSEPFPFKEEHLNELQKTLPNSKILIVDGEVFSWYGSRLLHLNAYIKDLKKQLHA
jgi:ABC-type Fe3+-hydroxamate transport system substrate-binding protein